MCSCCGDENIVSYLVPDIKIYKSVSQAVHMSDNNGSERHPVVYHAATDGFDGIFILDTYKFSYITKKPKVVVSNSRKRAAPSDVAIVDVELDITNDNVELETHMEV